LRRPSFYYWFATTRVVSEVKHHKLARHAGARPSLAVARAGAKAWMARTGMRLDPALRALEDRARRLVSAPIGGPAGLGS
jgi:hypothetical protein